LLSMIQQSNQENLLKFLQTQNITTLKTILQCFVLCQYDAENCSGNNIMDTNNICKLLNIISKVNNDQNKDTYSKYNERNEYNNKLLKLYDTNNFNEHEKNILSIFEKNFDLSLSRTKPLVKDVLILVFQHFDYWEVCKYFALVDKQWNSAAQAYKTIAYYHGNIFLRSDNIKKINEIVYVDYRREEDGKFVTAKNVENEQYLLNNKISLQHSSNIREYKSGPFDPSKYCNILAYYNSIVNQTFVKNELLLSMKNDLVQGKIMDISLKNCYLIYNNIKYFQIRISGWICGIIYDLSFLYNENNNSSGSIWLHKNNNNNKKNNMEKPYTSQIPLIVDITDWCHSTCENDHAETIYHNLYSYDFKKKKFIKIEKSLSQCDIILFQYWVHGDFINEIAPFQTYSSVDEQRKMRKMMPILLDIPNNKKNSTEIINSNIAQLNLIK